MPPNCCALSHQLRHTQAGQSKVFISTVFILSTKERLCASLTDSPVFAHFLLPQELDCMTDPTCVWLSQCAKSICGFLSALAVIHKLTAGAFFCTIPLWYFGSGENHSVGNCSVQKTSGNVVGGLVSLSAVHFVQKITASSSLFRERELFWKDNAEVWTESCVYCNRRWCWRGTGGEKGTVFKLDTLFYFLIISPLFPARADIPSHCELFAISPFSCLNLHKACWAISYSKSFLHPLAAIEAFPPVSARYRN